MLFQGVADASGDLYWAECTADAVCDLVSGTSGGAIRFRAPLLGVRRFGNLERGDLVVAGELVTQGLERGTIRAFKTSDGSVAWSHDLRADLCEGHRSHDSSTLAIRSITSGRAGELFLEADGDSCDSKSRGHWVISLWAASGRLRWVKAYERAPSGLVASEDGDLFFQGHLKADDGWSPYLISLSSSGRERWRRIESWLSQPVAAFGGRLFGANREVWQTATGARLFRVPVGDAWRGQRNAFTLVSERSAFVIGSPELACVGAGCSIAIQKIDLSAGELSWRVALSDGDQPSSISQPILTSADTILFAQSTRSSTLLREFSSDGREIHSVPLRNGRYAGAALLSNRWIAAVESPAPEIRAFQLGPERARRSGWISWGGDVGCGGAPQEERRAAAARRPATR